MKRSVDRILTTHVGSLIRPPKLGEIGLRDATADVVRRQIQAGIDIVNDGEFGKSSWANYVLDRMTGFEFRPDSIYPPVWLGRDRERFAEFMSTEFPRGAKGLPGHACVAPITYTGYDAIRRNIADLKAALGAAGVEEGFLTAVAPASTGYDASDEFYDDELGTAEIGYVDLVQALRSGHVSQVRVSVQTPRQVRFLGISVMAE